VSSRSIRLGLSAASLLAVTSLAAPGPGDEPARGEQAEAEAKAKGEGGPPALATAPAVACLSIKGFEDYEPLPDAALTADEKLIVYYRPLHYRVEHGKKADHIHLFQDGQVRRRGKAPVLRAKSRLLDYEWTGNTPGWQVYLKNEVSLKGLAPGEYEYDIILHDALAPDDAVARQSLPFRVIPAGPRPGKEEGPPQTPDGDSKDKDR
jgi:hypothetical protein